MDRVLQEVAEDSDYVLAKELRAFAARTNLVLSYEGVQLYPELLTKASDEIGAPKQRIMEFLKQRHDAFIVQREIWLENRPCLWFRAA